MTRTTTLAAALLIISVVPLHPALAEEGPALTLDKWTYIQVDGTRGKWGDFGEPKGLKYFGLGAFDVTGDGYKDIVSGRYFYRNPGGDMTGRWRRADLGLNVDALLCVDVDGDDRPDCIAQALPNVYWLETEDRSGNSWRASVIGQLPKTGHVNGQGFTLAQIIPGGKAEIVLSSGKGIYYFQIPDDPEAGNWPRTHVAPEASEEGIGTGDIDGDKDLDIAAGYGKKGEGMSVAWWENPGNGRGNWKLHHVGKTVHFADRVAVADLNADGHRDLIVTEEWWRSHDRIASLYWFEQKRGAGPVKWVRHTVVTAGSLNNLGVADMDRDGDFDIVTCEHKGENERLLIFENDGKGRFREHLLDRGKESHLGTQLFDMDGDADLDILSIAWDDYQYLHLWRNDATAPRK